jgi:hypothetical protein
MTLLDTVATLVLTLASPAFGSGGDIPSPYSCDGKNVNPPLVIQQVPAEAQSVALIVDDPDAPGQTWVHWVVYNIPAEGKTVKIPENTSPGQQGYNDFQKQGYGGPCPPNGTHRYYFKAYALDQKLNFAEDTRVTKQRLLAAMEGHIVAKGELMGRYSRQR